MKVLMLGLMIIVAIFVTDPVRAMKEPPYFELLTPVQLSALCTKANEGNREAQDEIVRRNYWNFLDRSPFIDSNFSDYKDRITLLSWKDI